jgi:hypothetical protein
MFNKIEKRVLNRISSLKKIRRVRNKPSGKIIKSFSALDEKKLEEAKRIVFGNDRATVKLEKVNRLFR